MELRRAVFFDRDGVVNVCPGAAQFVREWRGFQFMPGVREALRRLHAAGFLCVLITNQSGVGRGLMTQAALDEIHTNMQRELGGVAFNAIYFCPHAPDENCACRKPAPEMVLRACREHGIDRARSFLIGDQGRDIEMGRAAGCTTVLCKNPLPEPGVLKPAQEPHVKFCTLPEVTVYILQTAEAGTR